MYCPYKENYGCPYVDTAGMDKTMSCQECEVYIASQEKEKDDMDDWNNFMMGL
jgi:hypothetical protein